MEAAYCKRLCEKLTRHRWHHLFRVGSLIDSNFVQFNMRAQQRVLDDDVGCFYVLFRFPGEMGSFDAGPLTIAYPVKTGTPENRQKLGKTLGMEEWRWCMWRRECCVYFETPLVLRLKEFPTIPSKRVTGDVQPLNM